MPGIEGGMMREKSGDFASAYFSFFLTSLFWSKSSKKSVLVGFTR